MEQKTLYKIIIVLAGLLSGSLLYNYKQYRDSEETKTIIKTEYKEKEVVKEVHDTIVQLRSEHVVDTAYIPIPPLQGGKDEADVVEDSSFVALPIVQKTYTNDTLYTAYVSGVKYHDLPKLDSISVKQKTVYQTTTITKEVQRKQKKFGVGVIGGYGYGLESKRVDPYIGIGISYHLFEF